MAVDSGRLYFKFGISKLKTDEVYPRKGSRRGYSNVMVMRFELTGGLWGMCRKSPSSS